MEVEDENVDIDRVLVEAERLAMQIKSASSRTPLGAATSSARNSVNDVQSQESSTPSPPVDFVDTSFDNCDSASPLTVGRTVVDASKTVDSAVASTETMKKTLQALRDSKVEPPAQLPTLELPGSPATSSAVSASPRTAPPPAEQQDDVVPIMDYTANANSHKGVKWEKVNNATPEDDDYVQMEDYSRLPTGRNNPAQSAGVNQYKIRLIQERKRARRRKKTILRVAAFVAVLATAGSVTYCLRPALNEPNAKAVVVPECEEPKLVDVVSSNLEAVVDEVAYAGAYEDESNIDESVVDEVEDKELPSEVRTEAFDEDFPSPGVDLGADASEDAGSASTIAQPVSNQVKEPLKLNIDVPICSLPFAWIGVPECHESSRSERLQSVLDGMMQ